MLFFQFQSVENLVGVRCALELKGLGKAPWCHNLLSLRFHRAWTALIAAQIIGKAGFKTLILKQIFWGFFYLLQHKYVFIIEHLEGIGKTKEKKKISHSILNLTY